MRKLRKCQNIHSLLLSCHDVWCPSHIVSCTASPVMTLQRTIRPFQYRELLSSMQLTQLPANASNNGATSPRVWTCHIHYEPKFPRHCVPFSLSRSWWTKGTKRENKFQSYKDIVRIKIKAISHYVTEAIQAMREIFITTENKQIYFVFWEASGMEGVLGMDFSFSKGRLRRRDGDDVDRCSAGWIKRQHVTEWRRCT